MYCLCQTASKKATHVAVCCIQPGDWSARFERLADPEQFACTYTQISEHVPIPVSSTQVMMYILFPPTLQPPSAPPPPPAELLQYMSSCVSSAKLPTSPIDCQAIRSGRQSQNPNRKAQLARNEPWNTSLYKTPRASILPPRPEPYR
jgi:hypothetical protein